jgi:triacylglycerol esterase/lipase EstA (alpha/beta hydrolase family)
MTHLSSSCVRTPQSQLYWVRVGVQFQPGAKIQSVPGFSGWGAPLLGTLNYWGGVEDIPKLLLNKGYTVIVSSIGPLSSNWERACELYRELTCGR